ncbi:MAG: hypothetical protein R3F56_10575 [Planctomycetota bacterium]
MNKLFLVLPLLAANAFAQTTYRIVGDIDSIQGTNLFELDCTRIRLVSNSVNLQALHDASRQQDIEYDMQVTDVSSGGLTILNVLSATAVPEQFNMGNLRFGRTETWDLFGTVGSAYQTWLTTRNATTFLPLPAFGNAWFMGPTGVPVFQGVMNQSFIQWGFQMPTIPALVGVEFSAQTILVSPSNVVSLTNPDCRVVRNN